MPATRQKLSFARLKTAYTYVGIRSTELESRRKELAGLVSDWLSGLNYGKEKEK